MQAARCSGTQLWSLPCRSRQCETAPSSSGSFGAHRGRPSQNIMISFFARVPFHDLIPRPLHFTTLVGWGHRFRYLLLMIARQYALENQTQTTRGGSGGSSQGGACSGSGSRWPQGQESREPLAQFCFLCGYLFVALKFTPFANVGDPFQTWQ